jgi:hypothetical protein
MNQKINNLGTKLKITDHQIVDQGGYNVVSFVGDVDLQGTKLHIVMLFVIKMAVL